MLKKIRLLFLGLIVIAGSACVTPTHASSAPSVVFSYVQTTGITGAKEELIVIHNNGATDVDVSDWCLINKANVAFACFTRESVEGGALHPVLPAYSSAIIAAYDYLAARAVAPEMVSLIYTVTNQTSGSIVSNADVISLLDEEGEAVAVKGWTAAPPAGKAWSRTKLLSAPDIYATGNEVADWTSIAWIDLPAHMLEKRFMAVGESGGDEDPHTDLELPPPSNTTESGIVITEILANATGSDEGKEYIEFHNTHPTETQSLDGLSVSVGIENPKSYELPAGVTIPPGEYAQLTDDELGFSLGNTNGGVQLHYGEVPLGNRIEYGTPKEDYAWAFIDGVWQYTNALTPGAANLASPPRESESSDETTGSAQKLCASNQFRNPETGRCKLIATATKAATPCKEGQERNIETGRCRAIAVTGEPTPCKEGQERNPETNRCRNITKMSSVDYGVKGVQEKAGAQLSWYYWVAIIGIIALILAYAVWEWRAELLATWRRVKGMIAKK